MTTQIFMASTLYGAATLAAAEKASEKQIREDAVGLHAKAQADKTSKGEYAAAAALYKVTSRGLVSVPRLTKSTTTSARSTFTT